MPERRSIAKELAAKLEQAKADQRAAQAAFDAADGDLIAANAHLAALEQAYDLVKPQPRRRTKKEKTS